jgi:hypothetical protein
MKLTEGDWFDGVLLETYIEKGISRPRVRPYHNLPKDLKVEFPREMRDKNPIGARFRADVKVCQKHNRDGSLKGGIYLRADKNSIELIDTYKPKHIIQSILNPNSKSKRAYHYSIDDSSNHKTDTFQKLRKKARSDWKDKIVSIGENQALLEQNQIISDYAQARSNGYCEGCDSIIPFITQNGNPYLKVYNLNSLSDKNYYNPDNVAALCPNCQQKAENKTEDNNIHNKKILLKIRESESSIL